MGSSSWTRRNSSRPDMPMTERRTIHTLAMVTIAEQKPAVWRDGGRQA